MFVHVIEVTWLDDHRLKVEFDDGAVKQVDLSDELEGEIFQPLRDPDFFRRVRVNPETGTVEWPNGADFAPEFLHEKGEDVEQEA